MKYPNLNEEKKLWKKGHKIVVGLDEVGRGPLAGPVVAAAVVIKSGIMNPSQKAGRQELGILKEIKDSKKLRPRKREEIFKALKQIPEVEWGIGRVSEKIIDKINILEATKLAMKRAVKNLEKKLNVNPVTKIHDRGIFDMGQFGLFLLIDGNFGIDLDILQKSIIKGDEKVFSCALASIIAKVTRDRMMLRYHKKYPQYGFDMHKGYPTRLHREMLKKYNPLVIHRMTFTLLKK